MGFLATIPWAMGAFDHPWSLLVRKLVWVSLLTQTTYVLDHRVEVVHQRFPFIGCWGFVLFVLVNQFGHIFAKFMLEIDLKGSVSCFNFGHESVWAVRHLTGHTLNFVPIEWVYSTSMLAQRAFEKLDFVLFYSPPDVKNVFLLDRDLTEAQICQVWVWVYDAT